MVRYSIPCFLVACLLLPGMARAQTRSDVKALFRPPQATTSLGPVEIEDRNMGWSLM
jgi:hypothetical protein